jgi:hypothetical protein
MNTKFVSIKEFRQNIASYAKAAQTKAARERLIVMNRTTPLFEVKPFEKDARLEALFSDIAKARKDIAAGRVYSHDEVLKELS